MLPVYVNEVAADGIQHSEKQSRRHTFLSVMPRQVIVRKLNDFKLPASCLQSG
jgi:hypothetical protein